MRTRLSHWWERLKSSYWFVPALMIAGAVVLALITLLIDRRFIVSPEGYGWLYTGGVDGARSLLSTVAASVITVAGVVFSITIAALTQASTQFGPRLLRNFMRDTGNQVVLGTFVSTFAYCLLVLRTTYGEDGRTAVPNLSVTTAMILAAASIGVLVYFIHHISQSIQAPQLVAVVGRELESAVNTLFPEELGRGPAELPATQPRVPPDLEQNARPVHAPRSGYVQAVDEDGLVAAAHEADVIVKLDARPGDFVINDRPMLYVHPAGRAADELVERLARMLMVGSARTPEQDAEFAINQLVEIAVRALSPGINDPFTAVNCVDWLGAALCRLAGRRFPSPYRFDKDGSLRVIARVHDFGGMCDSAFNQIRQYGAGSVAVTLRLLETIQRIAACARTDEQRAALLRHARMIEHPDRNTFDEAGDQLDLKRRVAAAVAAIESANGARARAATGPARPEATAK